MLSCHRSMISVLSQVQVLHNFTFLPNLEISLKILLTEQCTCTRPWLNYTLCSLIPKWCNLGSLNCIMCSHYPPQKLHCTILELNNLPSSQKFCSNFSDPNLNCAFQRSVIKILSCLLEPHNAQRMKPSLHTKTTKKCLPSLPTQPILTKMKNYRGLSSQAPLLPSPVVPLKIAQTCLPRSHPTSATSCLSSKILHPSGFCVILPQNYESLC